jgi:RHS repeat-associated protein
MRTDLLVGVQFADNRVYSPTLMRWLQTDPIGLNAGNNAYEIVGNSPTDAVDPTGLDRQRSDAWYHWAAPLAPWKAGFRFESWVLYNASDALSK